MASVAKHPNILFPRASWEGYWGIWEKTHGKSTILIKMKQGRGDEKNWVGGISK